MLGRVQESLYARKEKENMCVRKSARIYCMFTRKGTGTSAC